MHNYRGVYHRDRRTSVPLRGNTQGEHIVSGVTTPPPVANDHRFSSNSISTAFARGRLDQVPGTTGAFRHCRFTAFSAPMGHGLTASHPASNRLSSDSTGVLACHVEEALIAKVLAQVAMTIPSRTG